MSPQKPPSDIARAYRTEYEKGQIDEGQLPESPWTLFERWFQEAYQSGDEFSNAFTLGTVDAQGQPHARVVLMRGYDPSGLVFYTNYNGRKGSQIGQNDRVSAHFLWQRQERQFCLLGRAVRLDAAASDAYFASRPRTSQIGAWASPQSQPIEGRAVLERLYQEQVERFEGQAVPRPEYWGGYRVEPSSIEFWQGRHSRLHDRFLCLPGPTGWTWQRLAP